MFEIVFGGIFLLAGLAALFFSICLFRSAFRKQKSWRSAAGIVVGYAESIRDTQRQYRSQVQFTTSSGNQVVITSNVGSTTHPNRIGDRVKVLYDLNEPDKGVIKSFSNLFMGPFIIGFIAICFIGVGGHIIYTLFLPKM